MGILLASLITIGLSVFVFFHKSLLRRLDAIDADLKPMVTQNALTAQTLADHDKRITRLENKTKQ